MDLRSQLRIETTPLHKEAEKASSTFASVETVEGYRNFLSGMQSVYKKHQDALDASSRLLGLEARSAQILQALADDLKSFPQFIEKPSGEDPPAQRLETAELLGTAYVFEGSALGSEILLKQVSKNFSTLGFKNSYLKLLSLAAKKRWPVVIQQLSSAKESNEIAVSQASSIFCDVTQAMERAGGKQ